MKQGDFTAAFASDLFESGVVAVPALLLEKYVYLGLSEKELAFILQILSLKQKHGHKFPSASEIISLGSFESQELDELVDSLVQKNHLKIEKNEEDTYSLAPLFEHLSELWAQSQIACGVCDQKEVEPEEIKKALRMRKIEGMHVIPAPTLEVQSRFLGALIEPLHIILPHHKETASPQLWTEQSMVRPTFTTLGKFYITETALKQIITYVINSSHLFGPIHNIAILDISKQKGNVVFKIELSGIYGTPLHLRTKILQKLIKKEVEYATNLNVQAVNIKIKNLVFKAK